MLFEGVNRVGVEGGRERGRERGIDGKWGLEMEGKGRGGEGKWEERVRNRDVGKIGGEEVRGSERANLQCRFAVHRARQL